MMSSAPSPHQIRILVSPHPSEASRHEQERMAELRRRAEQQRRDNIAESLGRVERAVQAAMAGKESTFDAT